MEQNQYAISLVYKMSDQLMIPAFTESIPLVFRILIKPCIGVHLSITKSVDHSVPLYVQQKRPVKQLVNPIVQMLLDKPVQPPISIDCRPKTGKIILDKYIS